ncbi:frizzled-3 [Anopheles nili]|uniref:frizzled-3 n=1 Tax=Anopheles nili TaxID=185578 RepID=UPI00237A6BB0|nr:frizzled-3 [Anopheles nili]
MVMCGVTGEELRCERIMVSACQNLVYEMTIASAPETALQYLAHGAPQAGGGVNSSASASSSMATGQVRTWLDAERLITSLRPIIDSGCSKQALFLFCSSLFPLCSPMAPRPVHPCRSLCEQVRRDCFSEPPHSKLWPAYLDCRALPQPEKHGLCMQVPSDATGSVEHHHHGGNPHYHLPLATNSGGSSAAGSSPPSTVTHDSIEPVVTNTGGGRWSISNLTSLLQHTGGGASMIPTGADGPSWSDRISSILLAGPGLMLPPGVGGSSNTNGADPTTRVMCPANYSLEYDRCVPRCGPTIDALYSQRQKELVESWTLVLSAVCFIFTLTSLVSFWARAVKLEYPDRPILFMTLCYNLLGVCYLERTILHSPRRLEAAAAAELLLLDTSGSPVGSASVAAAAAAAANNPAVRSDCSITSQCLAYYILKHYLLLSAHTWWLIFGLCWYLSTAKQWSCEALERKSGLFHVLAWVVPFAAPIGALLRGHIQRFELTGFCTARGFTELPALLLLLAGAALVALALAALARLRLCWNQRAPHLGRVFGRVLIFAICYLLPALAATICLMLERVDHVQEPCPTGDGAGCPAGPRFSLLPTVLRLGLTLIGGGLVGVWLWSRHPSEGDTGTTRKSPPAPSQLLIGAGGLKTNSEGSTRVTTNTRRLEGRPSSMRVDDPAVIRRDGPLLSGVGRYKDSSTDRRSSSRASRANNAYRSASAGGRPTDKGKNKPPKFCYSYRPCAAGALSEQSIALRTPPDLSPGSYRSETGPGRSPYAVGSGGTSGGGGYVPVRVHRSLRAVPMSMITRI